MVGEDEGGMQQAGRQGKGGPVGEPTWGGGGMGPAFGT